MSRLRNQAVFPGETGLFEVHRKMRNGDTFACDSKRWEITSAIRTEQGSRVKTVSAVQVEGAVGGLPVGIRIPWEPDADRDRVYFGYQGFGREARLPENIRRAGRPKNTP
jgi:hypothetical protein